MHNEMYYKTFSILSLFLGRKSPTVFNLLLFATGSSLKARGSPFSPDDSLTKDTVE